MINDIFLVNPNASASDVFNEAALLSGHINSITGLLAEMGEPGSVGPDIAGTFYAIAKLNELATHLYSEAFRKKRHEKKSS